MSMYCIGDIQGCDEALGRLIEEVDFSPSRDTLYLLGDLVNRGPQSLQVLRRCIALGDAVRPLLGNHDLHLLAAAHGVRPPGKRDTLQGILQAPDRAALLDWLRRQPLARLHTTAAGERLLMVHAGVLPAWDVDQTLALASEVEAALRSDDLPSFLATMYGNAPAAWSDGLEGADRLRVIVNALTRMRFCTPEGRMDFDSSDSASEASAGLLPWYDLQGRRTADTPIAFGHWSTQGLVARHDLIGLDTGCVWGGCLSAMRFGDSLAERELIQVHCEQQQPTK
ncbi:symmetrical bis(5'-nucleosyl)-tetraphosphatase [Comamonas endophytica]|uniref:Bis(5'-nucleosyl)-tetraphosphatase, symmetrical n=1 Tax=Comamonas endophytica TaxID=2949090 RepID=A0ABY6G8K7_9BURK|nr:MULTISPECIES: symmetrical bis(5'-nucleosyl)-tetraphosphatase [unclassified Acidovorax]MCD2511541.1 symmetrical bis(5'-nucleosyl)-tetraphosphatase [Acidovorax sp. D4N7]UYG50927.1 symmetrical bis(5'-nucleosyl)-tetraphosphatase [Acidovorax sp. 5MLIR]